MEQIGYPFFMNLALCIPYSGRNLPPKLQRAFHAMQPPMNTNTIVFETTAKPIAEARQFFAEQAIANKAKYLFFWDEDVLVPPQALRELIFIAEHFPKHAVIGGIYCLKTDRPEPLVFRGGGNGPYWDWKVGEVFDVTGIGMGCCLIRTEVFKDLPKPWFKTVNDQSSYLDNVPFGEVWTEDLYFCRKVMETKKWKIAAHGQLLCPHVDVNTGREYMLSPDSKPFREIAMPVGRAKMLDIGCGSSPYRTNEGTTVTVDVRDGVNPDYRCDWNRLPFATGEFDVVYSSNTLEHVPRWEVKDTLREWVRVLKPKGEFRLIVPNLELAAKYILEGKGNDIMKGTVNVTAMDVLYGSQSYYEDRHFNGFTKQTITSLLKEHGFKSIDVKESTFELQIIAKRDHALDRQPKRKSVVKR